MKRSDMRWHGANHVQKNEGRRRKTKRGHRRGKIAPDRGFNEKVAAQFRATKDGGKERHKALHQQLWATMYADGAGTESRSKASLAKILPK